MTRLLILIAALMVCCGARAEPRNIDGCEAIKQADAYNRCLASFGPVPKGRGGGSAGKLYQEPPREASRGAKEYGRHARRHYESSHHSGYGRRGAYSHGGRVRMEFTPRR
jgi:hypothetical protein